MSIYAKLHRDNNPGKVTGLTLNVNKEIPLKSDDLHPGQVLTLNHLQEVNRITLEIIENLDDVGMAQLLSGYQDDVDNLLVSIEQEIKGVLYGDHELPFTNNYSYLERLSENLEDTLRIENLNYFITSVLPEFEVSWHHLEWGEATMRYNKLCVEAARDHGKSYFFSNAYPIWKMYRYKKYDKLTFDVRRDLIVCGSGYLITNELDLAQDLLEIVKNTIEENDILREKLFPEVKDNWGKQSIKTKNGARLRVKSYGGSFRGRHPGYVIVDDFLKDNVIYSDVQRKKSIDYFHSVIMNAVLKDGQTIVVGTPFHHLDLYGDLKTKKHWKVFEYPAIFPDGRILWPGRHDYQSLMEKKESQGNLIFSRENLCRPIISDSTIFPYDILKRSFIGMQDVTLVSTRDSYKEKFSKVIVGCDFAMSSSVGADYSVFTVWGISNLDEMWLMNIYREKGKSYMEQMSVLRRLNVDFRPDLFIMEANAFQQIFHESSAEHGLPVVKHVTTGANKHNLLQGLPGVAILFERGKIKFPRGDKYSIDMTDLICSEFSSIAFTDKGLGSVGQHDDTAMSTWLGDVGRRKMTLGVGIGFLEE